MPVEIKSSRIEEITMRCSVSERDFLTFSGESFQMCEGGEPVGACVCPEGSTDLRAFANALLQFADQWDAKK